MMYLFSNVKPRARIDGREVDVFIPTISVAVEYDGSFWHRDKEESDLAKTAHLLSCGLRVIRVRENPLQALGEYDVVIPVRSNLLKTDVDQLVAVLELFCDGNLRDSLSQYRSQGDFQNDAIYQEYMSYSPDPFPEDSLELRFPELASEFDGERNYPITPRNLSWGSGRKVWWRCKKSELHVWPATVSNRTNATNETGCPFCSGRMVCADNNLAVLFAEVAEEWHPQKNNDLRPESITPGYRENVFWKCRRNASHEWPASPYNRTKNKSGCPYCAGQRSDAENNLAVLNPSLAREWHPIRNGDLKPEHVARSSGISVCWKCPVADDHEWVETVNNRANGKGCPFCAGKRACATNNVVYCFPEVAKLWHHARNEKNAADFVPGSYAVVWWKCPIGDDHEWQAQIQAMTGRKDLSSACPVCRSLAFRFPQIAGEWHPALNGTRTPANVSHGSSFLAWWMCSRNASHVWPATVNHRTSRMQRCPSCRDDQ
jgi:hypothetical protein